MYVFFNRPWLCLKDCVNKYHWHSVHYTLRLRLFSVLRRNSVSVSPRHSFFEHVLFVPMIPWPRQESSRYRDGQLFVSLSCFASAVFRFCNRTAAARVGAGRRPPGVVRLDPPRIAAAVKVRASGPGFRIQLGRWCGGGPPFRDLLRRRGQGVTSGETRVVKRTTVRWSVDLRVV